MATREGFERLATILDNAIGRTNPAMCTAQKGPEPAQSGLCFSELLDSIIREQPHMVLADFVAREAGVSIDKIMLLRHSNANVDELLKRGSSIEEYTILQPIGSKYDYADPSKPTIEVVVVIVHDTVWGVYRVLGVEHEGTTYGLASAAHRNFDIERGAYDRPARLFKVELIPSTTIGHPITGWEGRTRTTVQRFDGGFFREVRVNLPGAPTPESVVRQDEAAAVAKSLLSDPKDRARRLVNAPRLPTRIEVVSTAFLRNPDVIAEVLLRAGGVCELCANPAPFQRRSDGSPYLEVHHRIRLADNGEDTVENAIAICPNCHRRKHYG